MYKIPALTNWAMWVYWGVRWDLNPCHKEPQSSALPDWATNTVLMERLELSTTTLWEQPSTIEVHQHIFLKDKELEWASKDLNLHYYLIRVASWPIRRHAHFADSIGIEPITLVLETNVLPLNYEPILAVVYVYYNIWFLPCGGRKNRTFISWLTVKCIDLPATPP